MNSLVSHPNFVVSFQVVSSVMSCIKDRGLQTAAHLQVLHEGGAEDSRRTFSPS